MERIAEQVFWGAKLNELHRQLVNHYKNIRDLHIKLIGIHLDFLTLRSEEQIKTAIAVANAAYYHYRQAKKLLRNIVNTGARLRQTGNTGLSVPKTIYNARATLSKCHAQVTLIDKVRGYVRNNDES